jgi:hypothetical protein
VNIKGVLNGIAAVLPTFIEQKSGQVIATSSVAGLKAYPGGAIYGGTKWFVRDFMEVLRMESAMERPQRLIFWAEHCVPNCTLSPHFRLIVANSGPETVGICGPSCREKPSLFQGACPNFREECPN